MEKKISKLNLHKVALKAKNTKLENFIKTYDTSNAIEILVKIDIMKNIQLSVALLQNDYYELPESQDLTVIEEEFHDSRVRLEELEVRFETLLNYIIAKNANFSINISN